MTFTSLFQKTALHIAAEKGYANIVSALLDNPRIDVNIKTIIIKLFLITF